MARFLPGIPPEAPGPVTRCDKPIPSGGDLTMNLKRSSLLITLALVAMGAQAVVTDQMK